MISETSLKAVNLHCEASYLLALMNTRQEVSCPQQIYGNGNFRKDESVLDGNIRNGVLWREQFHGRKIGWPSELLQKVGEVEGTMACKGRNKINWLEGEVGVIFEGGR